MAKLLIVFAALVAVGLAANDNGRVVGGTVARNGQFPFIASLRIGNNFHTCGGSILSSRWVLTAAHCVDGVKQMTVVVGTNHLQSGGIAYPVELIVSHADYNPKVINNDVALLKVSTDIQFNNLVQPISLGSSIVGEGKKATLAGWGKTSTNGQASEALLYLDTYQTLSPQSCAAALYPNPTYESEICVFDRVSHGACQGDSGGPLIVDGYLHGITSWVIPCAVGRPDVFTRVASFLPWIKNVIANN